jgi:hypothetical protein
MGVRRPPSDKKPSTCSGETSVRANIPFNRVLQRRSVRGLAHRGDYDGCEHPKMVCSMTGRRYSRMRPRTDLREVDFLRDRRGAPVAFGARRDGADPADRLLAAVSLVPFLARRVLHSREVVVTTAAILAVVRVVARLEGPEPGEGSLLRSLEREGEPAPPEGDEARATAAEPTGQLSGRDAGGDPLEDREDMARRAMSTLEHGPGPGVEHPEASRA